MRAIRWVMGSLLVVAVLPVAACGSNGGSDANGTVEAPALAPEALRAEQEARTEAEANPRNLPGDTAIFAGGCFWCMEAPFDRLDGVVSTSSGFTGGQVENPSYEEVTRGGTGHTEAVRIIFDPEVVSYDELLQVFWRNVDPLDNEGQFCDRGAHYRPGIFYRHADQQARALASRRELEESGRFERPVVVEVTQASGFWEAEEYHQGYYLKNPDDYRSYREGCGRDRRLAELWGADGG